MKKKYISPEIKLIKLHTENVMQNISSVSSNTPDGKPTDGPGYGGSSDGSQPETAKGNDVFIFWEDEN